MLIAADDVSVQRSGQTLLDRVSLEVQARELLSLIGPNGAGKSTLVRVLLGLLPPSSGQVRRAPGLRIGYMPQRLAIDPSLPLTVERFLSLVGNDRRQLDRCLSLTGTQELRNRPVQALSGGEVQRVLLGRALYRDPQLLVLDEPVQGVDVNGQAALYRLIAQIKDELGCGVLMVSHDLHLVMAATDRVICLNQHVCCEGSPASVGSSPQFRQLFGRQASGFAVYEHHHDHSHDHFQDDKQCR